MIFLHTYQSVLSQFFYRQSSERFSFIEYYEKSIIFSGVNGHKQILREKNGGDSQWRLQGPVSQNYFVEMKFVNAIKRHSAANFERQIHVVNGFVKLAPELMDGWLTCKFSSFSTVFQSYQKGKWVIMKGYVY